MFFSYKDCLVIQLFVLPTLAVAILATCIIVTHMIIATFMIVWCPLSHAYAKYFTLGFNCTYAFIKYKLQIAQGLFMLGTKQEDKGWVSGGKRARERLNKAISSAGSKSTGQLLPQVNQTTQPVLKSSSPSVDGTCSLATGSTAATQSGVSADMSRDDTTAAAGAK